MPQHKHPDYVKELSKIIEAAELDEEEDLDLNGTLPGHSICVEPHLPPARLVFQDDTAIQRFRTRFAQIVTGLEHEASLIEPRTQKPERRAMCTLAWAIIRLYRDQNLTQVLFQTILPEAINILGQIHIPLIGLIHNLPPVDYTNGKDQAGTYIGICVHNDGRVAIYIGSSYNMYVRRQRHEYCVKVGEGHGPFYETMRKPEWSTYFRVLSKSPPGAHPGTWYVLESVFMILLHSIKGPVQNYHGIATINMIARQTLPDLYDEEPLPLNRALPLRQGFSIGQQQKECLNCHVKNYGDSPARCTFVFAGQGDDPLHSFMCDNCWDYRKRNPDSIRPQALQDRLQERYNDEAIGERRAAKERRGAVNSPSSCDNCGLEMVHKPGYSKNLVFYIDVELWLCRNCDKRRKRRDDGQLHMSKRWKPACDKCTQSKKSLFRRHPINQYLCDECHSEHSHFGMPTPNMCSTKDETKVDSGCENKGLEDIDSHFETSTPNMSSTNDENKVDWGLKNQIVEDIDSYSKIPISNMSSTNSETKVDNEVNPRILEDIDGNRKRKRQSTMTRGARKDEKQPNKTLTSMSWFVTPSQKVARDVSDVLSTS